MVLCPSLDSVKLTPEQQAIVNHKEGAARVFAVAGAGKTTAMVHRIYRLVQAGIFAPNRILASSFSRGTVTSLESALSRWPVCRDVRTQTLHSLGYGVILKAWDCGYLAKAQSALAPDKVDGHLYNQALREARQQNLSFKDELEALDQEDFLAYVSNCKGRLHYADLSRVTFAPAGPHRQIAQPAEPPSEEELRWYLDLYRLFEDIRDRQGWISFDDMLMSGWQLLVQHPDLLSDLQDQFDCIIVDEFQDVNRAQFGILDLLSKPHRNYMVIGDDDQTIYEWRGAEVRFMLQVFDRISGSGSLYEWSAVEPPWQRLTATPKKKRLSRARMNTPACLRPPTRLERGMSSSTTSNCSISAKSNNTNKPSCKLKPSCKPQKSLTLSRWKPNENA